MPGEGELLAFLKHECFLLNESSKFLQRLLLELHLTLLPHLSASQRCQHRDFRCLEPAHRSPSLPWPLCSPSLAAQRLLGPFASFHTSILSLCSTSSHFVTLFIFSLTPNLNGKDCVRLPLSQHLWTLAQVLAHSQGSRSFGRK